MAVSLIKRAILAQGEDLPEYKLPDWAWIVMLLDLIVLLPITIIVRLTRVTLHIWDADIVPCPSSTTRSRPSILSSQ